MKRLLALLAIAFVFANHSSAKEKCDPVAEMNKLGFLNGQWKAKDNYQFTFSYALKNHMLSTDVESLGKNVNYLGKGSIAYDCKIEKYVYLYVNQIGEVYQCQGVLRGKDQLHLGSLPNETELTFDFRVIDGKMHWIYRGKKDGKWKKLWSTIAEPLRN